MHDLAGETSNGRLERSPAVVLGDKDGLWGPYLP